MKIFSSKQITPMEMARELESNPEARDTFRSIFDNPSGFIANMPEQMRSEELIIRAFSLYFEAWLLYDPDLEKLTNSEAQNIAYIIGEKDFKAMQHKTKDAKPYLEKIFPRQTDKDNAVKLVSPEESEKITKNLEPGKFDKKEYIDHILDLYSQKQISKSQMEAMLTEAKSNTKIFKTASGKQFKISKKQWRQIGEKHGWITSQHLDNVKTLDKLTDRELTRAIRDAIIAEEDAIKQYETVADSTDSPKAKEVLQDIADEEKVHVGELQELLKGILKDEQKFLDEGAKEVKTAGASQRLLEQAFWMALEYMGRKRSSPEETASLVARQMGMDEGTKKQLEQSLIKHKEMPREGLPQAYQR